MRRIAIVACAALLLAGCGKDDPTRPDTDAPALIADLTLIAVEDSSVTLVWTAPGDDGDRGTAAAYDLRFSADPSTPFELRTMLDGAPRPAPPGTQQVAILHGQSFAGDLFFQMKTADESGNWSAVSNQAMTRDQVPPAAVTDLAATTTGMFEVRVSWTSPGDDGAVGKAQSWELRYTTDPSLFDTEAGWDAATAVSGLPSPTFAGNHNQADVALTINTTYYLALRSIDDAGNESNLSNVVRIRTEELPAALLEEWRDSRFPQYAASIQRDRSGDVYVASMDRIVRMDAGGNVVSVRNGIGGRLALDPDGNLYALTLSVISGARSSLVRYSEDGTELFRWRSPDSDYRDLAIDPFGALFLLDSGNRVEVLRPVAAATSPPILVTSWSITNPGLDSPPPTVFGGIAATKDFVYVMVSYQETHAFRTTALQKYSKGGMLIANIPLQRTTSGFATLQLCSSDDENNLYVLDSSNAMVRKLDAAGSVRMRLSSLPDGADDVVAGEGRIFVLSHLLSGAGSLVKVYGSASLATRGH